MKQLLFLLSFVGLIRVANAQFNLFISFEDTIALKSVKIDTTNQSNLWQVGVPSKIVFNGAYSAPNAILTDTVLSYQANNHSSFIITIKSFGWFWGSPSTLSFYHKYNTDQGKDGGYIDVSYNGGSNWQNILFDTIMNTCPMGPMGPWYNNFYSNTDTLENGTPGFSGNSNGWEQTDISYLFCLGVKGWAPDSVMFRFNFVSDSIQTNKNGWMIDNILFNSDICSGINNGLSTSNIQTKVYPNPTNDKLTIEASFGSTDPVQIEILSIEGQTVFQKMIQQGITDLDISVLAKGVYFLRLSTEDRTEVTKIVKE